MKGEALITVHQEPVGCMCAWVRMLRNALDSTAVIFNTKACHNPVLELLFVVVVGCSTSQQHASVSQGQICSDNFMCCHTELEVADPTFHLMQSQYTDTGPISPSIDHIMPDAWQGSHWSANFEISGMTRPWKNPVASRNRTQDLLPRQMP